MSRFEILEDDEAGDYDTLDDAIDALEGGRTALRWMLAALVGESFFIASLLLLLVAAVVIGFDRVGWFAAMITAGLGVYGYLFVRTRRLIRQGRERRDRLAGSIDDAIARGAVSRLGDGPARDGPGPLEPRTEFGRLDRSQRRAYALVVGVAVGYPALIHFGPSDWDAFNIVLCVLLVFAGIASVRHVFRRGPSHRLGDEGLRVVGSFLANEIHIPWSSIDHVRLSAGLAPTLEIEVGDRREVLRAQGPAGKLELCLGRLFGRTISVALPQDVESREYLALLRSRIRRTREDELSLGRRQSDPTAGPDEALSPRTAGHHLGEDSGSGK